jgi:hypothetical protein
LDTLEKESEQKEENQVIKKYTPKTSPNRAYDKHGGVH